MWRRIQEKFPSPINMYILAIDTSADETAVAIVQGRKIISNATHSQILLHNKWGGIYPSLAKRAHIERIDFVIEEACKKFLKTIPSKKKGDSPIVSAMNLIDAVAVTQGPGLAIALEVGIQKAKDLAKTYGKKLIAVNHMEGHIYSCFAQNQKGNPKNPFEFPYLALLVSGGHTELVLFKDHLTYKVLGETLDDAGGEALDKAAKLLGLGYPGGPLIETLSAQVQNKDEYRLPRPMKNSDDLNFSFSGLKTAFYYLLKEMDEKEINKRMKYLASSFQEAVFESLLIKTKKAMEKTGVNKILLGGGVSANMYLRKRLRDLVKDKGGNAYFPVYPYLSGDNAAMIGVAASYKAKKSLFVKDFDSLDRVPRLTL